MTKHSKFKEIQSYKTHLPSLICNWLLILQVCHWLSVPVSQVKYLSAGWFQTHAQAQAHTLTQTLTHKHTGPLWFVTNITLAIQHLQRQRYTPHYHSVPKKKKKEKKETNKGTINLSCPSWKNNFNVVIHSDVK